MPLSSATKHKQACDVCVQSRDCARLGKCVRYKCKFGQGPLQKTYTTPPKDPGACGPCVDSARCIRLNMCLTHRVKFTNLKDKP